MAIDTLAERRALLGIPTPAVIGGDIYIGATSVGLGLEPHTANVDADNEVAVGLQFINLATQKADVGLDALVEGSTAQITLQTHTARVESANTVVRGNTATLTLQTHDAVITFDVEIESGTATTQLSTNAATINLHGSGTIIKINGVPV